MKSKKIKTRSMIEINPVQMYNINPCTKSIMEIDLKDIRLA